MYYFGKHENIMLGGTNMIVMDLKVDNFYAFKNYHINMSYPKKIKGSSIENEHLKGRENFRYKKVNIIMGGNASGKTSMGRMMMRIFNFIKTSDIQLITTPICDTTRPASFSIDLVGEEEGVQKLYRLATTITPKQNGDYNNSNLNVVVMVTNIRVNDSYESAVKRLSIEEPLEGNYIIQLEKVSKNFGWLFSYAENLKYLDHKKIGESQLNILNHTLRALDPSIIEVKPSSDAKDSYVIKTKHQNIIIQEGEVAKKDLLSSGTISGINIAHMIAAIKDGRGGFYYCDEKFSYVHSNVEKAFLSLMINELKENNQLFFTTHNLDILDMDLPKHAFTFLKKDVHNEFEPIKAINAADFLKRNTDSLRNAVENDLFSTSPSLDLIYEIESL